MNNENNNTKENESFQTFKNKILVVDDEPKNLKLMEAFLHKEKHKTISAADGNEAIHKAKTENPDLILLDILMPGLNGFEVTNILKKDTKTKKIPIILVTSLEGAENRITGLEAGAEEFLSKPVKSVELQARVNSMLQLKQYRDQLDLHEQSKRDFPEIALSPEKKKKKAKPIILLVEDNEIDANIVKSALKDEPYRIDVVRTAEETLNKVASDKIDLILLDILLPDRNGFELFHDFKKDDKTKHIPIVIITCLDDAASRIKGAELGADDFLVTPIYKRELKARISVLMDKKAKLDELHSYYKDALNSAISDWLTGIYNQGYLKKFLELEIKRSSRHEYPVGILMLDVDDFKKINDRFGHAAGDEVLRKSALAMREAIREIDLVARYGGDEFVIVLPYADKEATLKVAKRVQNVIHSIEYFFNSEKNPIHVTVSIGVAMHPSDAQNMDKLIKKADTELYKAKRKGKNTICV